MREDRDELLVDEQCARCGTPLQDVTAAVRRDGEIFCCANCALASSGEAGRRDEACSHCGAPIVDRSTVVTRVPYVYCCGSCAAVPLEAEPPVL